MEDLALLGLRGGGTEKYLEVLDRADSMRGFFFYFFYELSSPEICVVVIMSLRFGGPSVI